jgi:hypothetical protein
MRSCDADFVVLSISGRAHYCEDIVVVGKSIGNKKVVYHSLEVGDYIKSPCNCS